MSRLINRRIINVYLLFLIKDLSLFWSFFFKVYICDKKNFRSILRNFSTNIYKNINYITKIWVYIRFPVRFPFSGFIYILDPLVYLTVSKPEPNLVFLFGSVRFFGSGWMCRGLCIDHRQVNKKSVQIIGNYVAEYPIVVKSQKLVVLNINRNNIMRTENDEQICYQLTKLFPTNHSTLFSQIAINSIVS